MAISNLICKKKTIDDHHQFDAIYSPSRRSGGNFKSYYLQERNNCYSEQKNALHSTKSGQKVKTSTTINSTQYKALLVALMAISNLIICKKKTIVILNRKRSIFNAIEPKDENYRLPLTRRNIKPFSSLWWQFQILFARKKQLLF